MGLMHHVIYRLHPFKLLLARNGLGGEWHLAYHEFMKLYLQACVIYVDAYHVP